MSYFYERSDDGLVSIRFPETLDSHLFYDLRVEFESVVNEQQAKAFVLDASQLRSVDSTGIGLIAYLGKLAKRARIPIKIVELSGQPADMFQFLRMDKVIPIGDFATDAVLS